MAPFSAPHADYTQQHKHILAFREGGVTGDEALIVAARDEEVLRAHRTDVAIELLWTPTANAKE
jgi:hypothetical protein